MRPRFDFSHCSLDHRIIILKNFYGLDCWGGAIENVPDETRFCGVSLPLYLNESYKCAGAFMPDSELSKYRRCKSVNIHCMDLIKKNAFFGMLGIAANMTASSYVPIHCWIHAQCKRGIMPVKLCAERLLKKKTCGRLMKFVRDFFAKRKWKFNISVDRWKLIEP